MGQRQGVKASGKRIVIPDVMIEKKKHDSELSSDDSYADISDDDVKQPSSPTKTKPIKKESESESESESDSEFAEEDEPLAKPDKNIKDPLSAVLEQFFTVRVNNKRKSIAEILEEINQTMIRHYT